MRIVFNKIPGLAKLLYVIGFIILLVSMTGYFYFPTLLDPIRLQQAFIGGAIIVAMGSVVNTVHQFKRHKPERKE